MAKTLDQAGEKSHVAEIVYHGEKMILPEGMSIKDAKELLTRREKFLEEEVKLQEVFDVFPWDGANAIDEVLTKKFGWAAATATPGMFGPSPPRLISIEIDYNKTKQVPWGSFSLPGVEGLLQTSVSQKEGRVVFQLVASVKRKDEAIIKRIFEEVRAYLKDNSIYKGKAIKIRFLDDDGDKLQMPEPKFMDTSAISEDMVIYPERVQKQIGINLFTPIRRVKDCIANRIPIKRGVLLGGTYGTGKTLAATVASKIAVDNGITYVYVPRADELSHAIGFAKQNQSPACVIFCEDIDRALAGERSVAMDDILNIIDGIDTKSTNVIVVLTTNDLNAINPAMLRPGRLDAVIEVLPPDAKAVEKLLRLYGGDAIETSTDLSEAGKLLDGEIPAVISEVVKRAKLAQLALQPVGEPVTKLSEAALVASADSMAQQLKLLKDRSAEKPRETSDIADAMAAVVAKAMGATKEQVDAISKRVDEIHNSTC
ncbi:MAG: ATP-binding protein [Pseudomonadota bacterium]